VKILFLSTWFPYPPDNGAKIRVYHLLRALGQQHRVTLLSFAFGTAQPNGVAPLKTNCERIEVIPRNPFDRSRGATGLRFVHPVPAVERPLAEMKTLASEVMAGTSFDVVIASTTGMAAYTGQARELPKVLEEHNCWSRWAWERYRRQTVPWRRLRRWVSWWKRSQYESRLYRQFDLCTMVSEQDKAAARRILPDYGGRIEVVPNGVDCHRNRPGLAQPSGNTLIFNGALTYSANYDAMEFFLADILPLARHQEPNLSLTITGSTSGVDLAGLSLDDNVRFSGYVEDVRPLVAGAWACIAPIRQGVGTRLKILEAMALGTPVVATFKGAEGLDVTPGQDILIADRPAEFANQVVRLLRDPGLRRHLTGNARRLVEERYNWEEIGRRFVEMVEAVPSR
jgi:glycosyltransferase involved in cell wall biosynthesis